MKVLREKSCSICSACRGGFGLPVPQGKKQLHAVPAKGRCERVGVRSSPPLGRGGSAGAGGCVGPAPAGVSIVPGEGSRAGRGFRHPGRGKAGLAVVGFTAPGSPLYDQFEIPLDGEGGVEVFWLFGVNV